MRSNKKPPLKSDKTQSIRGHKRGMVGYSRKTALLEEAITQMNAGKYGRSSAALKELLALDPNNMEARRLFATLHLRLGSLIPARQAFDSLIAEAFQRQDYWLAESLLREYLAAGPRCVPFLEKLGALYQEKGNALEAAAEYGKAVDILMEDPDSDNTHHASLLYGKIRELAPASPTAFRLASFFDAQTGELLVRQPSDAGQSIAAPSLDMPDGRQSTQASLEPTAGMMPWEIQDSQATATDALDAIHVSDSSESLIPPTITGLSAYHEPTLDREAVPSDPPLPERGQPASSVSDVRADAPEESRIHEIGTASSEAQKDDAREQVVPESPGQSILPSEFAAEHSESQAPPGLDPAALTSCPAAVQEQDRLLAEAEPGALHDGSGSSTVSTSAEPTDGAQESPIDSVQAVERTGLMPPSPVEERSASASSGMESLTAGSTEAGDRPLSLLQPVEADPKEAVTEQSLGTSNPSNPEPLSTNEISEPWKQPGFSWESVFNSAWKFGNAQSTNTTPSGSTLTNVEEVATPTAAASPLQEQVLENQAVEIPERESPPLGHQTSSGSPIAPMPWDQVQESVIAISPAQTDQPVADNTESGMDSSADEAVSDWAPKVSESKAQSPPSPDSSIAETGSFSIAQTPRTPVSPEPEIAVVNVRQISVPAEGSHALAEPEQRLPVVDAPMVNELRPSEARQAMVASQIFTGSILSTDDYHAIAPVQSSVQESTAEVPLAPSQPTSETSIRETSEPSLLSPPPEPQKVWKPSPEIEIVENSHPAAEIVGVRAHARHLEEEAPVEVRNPVSEPLSEAAPIAQGAPTIPNRQDVGPSTSVAATAVDVLFESSRNVRATETQHGVESKPSRKSGSALIRARITIADFVSSCFSTSRAIVTTCVGLVLLSGGLIAVGIGAVGLTWIIMEESPSPVFQSFTTAPQRTLSDFKKNGYFLLLGIDASADHDPIQAGYDRKRDPDDGKAARACLGDPASRTIEASNASVDVMRGWVRSSDPVGQFKSHQETIKGWGNQHQPALNRYGRWQKLPFEDWGYGQTVNPPCTAMVFAHQLYLADGFLQGADLGVDRLEMDMEAWRIVLSQARTLAIKMLALQAVNDDIAVASGLLVHSDFDGQYLGRVIKFLRPLDQTELSMRWPMQSELVSAAKTYEIRLKAARAEEQPVYTMVASALPLPMQRRLNDYAEYYDASNKAAGERKYGSLPKWKNHIHFPASGLMDYFTNPIENIVGLEPLAPWDRYNGFVVDTDARLRLASLQAWLRRGSTDGDLLTRIAKAGQGFYDPYTGLPMLVNMKKGLLYSVGYDGKDQDADPQSDVVVEIPVGRPPLR